MAVVNVGTVITKALTHMTAGLSRAQFVPWFNEIMRDVINQPRTWKFLQDAASLPIVNNQIFLPATMTEITQITVGNHFFNSNDQLSDLAAAGIDDSVSSFGHTTPGEGFTVSPAGALTFHPPLTGTANVLGTHDFAVDYADLADTAFPLAFENLFITGLRMHFYDMDKDGRFTKENQQYQLYMYIMKSWDNRRKVRPQFNKAGYIR